MLSGLNRTPAPVAAIEGSAYGRNLGKWPRSWMGFEKDVPVGEQLVVCFRSFIEHLASSSLSPKTIRGHVDNLWLLGGEIIRQLNYNPSKRKLAANQLVHEAIGADGGPLLHSGSEEDQRSFDGTCRKLSRFLTPSQ